MPAAGMPLARSNTCVVNLPIWITHEKYHWEKYQWARVSHLPE
jgi:hypothetical protein